MKVNNETHDHREGRTDQARSGLDGADTTISARSADPGVDATVAAVCRNVVRLVNAAPQPPRRICMRHGQTTVEIEWPDGPGGRPDEATGGERARAGETSKPPAEPDIGTHYVCAPMVGTFYHATEPDTPPLVTVGDLVHPGQAVGILEVMKTMNTVTADVAGQVVAMVAANGQPVEFQERLVAIEPKEDARETDSSGRRSGGQVPASG